MDVPGGSCCCSAPTQLSVYSLPSLLVFMARSCSAVGIHFFTLTESPGQEVLMTLQLISACQPLGCSQSFPFVSLVTLSTTGVWLNTEDNHRCRAPKPVFGIFLPCHCCQQSQISLALRAQLSLSVCFPLNPVQFFPTALKQSLEALHGKAAVLCWLPATLQKAAIVTYPGVTGTPPLPAPQYRSGAGGAHVAALPPRGSRHGRGGRGLAGRGRGLPR